MNTKSPLIRAIEWSVILGLRMVVEIGSAHGESEVRITDFGARPDSRLNVVVAVQRALEACRKLDQPVLVFPPGRYDFWPQGCLERDYFESNTTQDNPKRLAILIENFGGLTVEGNGSTFVFHDRMQPFTVDHSTQVTLRNCSLDWDIPLTAEGTVEAAAADHLDLRLDDRQFPYVLEGGKLVFVGEGWKSAWGDAMEFDALTLRVVAQTGDSGCLGPRWRDYRAEELEKGRIRLWHPFGRRPAPGNILVLRHSVRDHAGLFIVNSKEVTVENIDMHHCAGLGLLAQYSENLTVRRFRAVPSPRRKVLSGHDDGVHVSNCRGLVRIEDCRFHGLMDDPINLHGTSVRIIERTAPNRLVCKFMHHQSTGMIWSRTGDRIGFIDHESLRTIAHGVCARFETRDRDTFEVMLESPAPESLQVGDALENLTWAPDVEIRGCHFASNRARGILVSTPGRVVIENNRFESSGSAILISGDANQWYESGAVTDVTIRRNLFDAPCLTSMYQFSEGIISIDPEIPKPDPMSPFHRNIRIEDNEFHPFDYPVLFAKSVRGLVFSNNRLIRSHEFAAFHARKATLTFEACREIRVEGNRFEGEVLGRNIALEQTGAVELQIGPGQGWVPSVNGQ
ncbi:MAG: right-handed parallel beta-helix repeat-containing protein [Verrucomicrobiales bacterium]|nr:right-handed parallel beta-helix repeat-containing protein [Verrucomicrobiales bacterium]